MHIFKTKREILEFAESKRDSKNKVGFIPTMGALHMGHISLVERSILENDISIASIFVNPTQFNNPEDLEKYPNTIEQDIEKLKEAGVDALFAPNVNEIYGSEVKAKKYDFGNLDKVMEGEHRLGHFDGVATIVKILFDYTKPHKAYFGEKDFQQLQIIKKLTELENLDVEIVSCPIIREEDGLAMSSRNVRLSDIYRKEAPFIYKILLEAKKRAKKLNAAQLKDFVELSFRENNLLNLEYFEIRDEDNLFEVSEFQAHKKYRAFIAVFAQNIRLIDNIQVF